MVHIVVLKDSISEDPEVIYTRDEVYDTQGVVLSLANISEQVLPPDLDPVVFDHKPNIVHRLFTLRVEDSVFLVGFSPFEEPFEEF